MQGNGMGYHQLIRVLTSSSVSLYHNVQVVGVSIIVFVAGRDCKGGGAGMRAGEDVRDGRGESASVVRRPRSLIVSFCGFTWGSGTRLSRCDCCDAMGPFDSSDELSVPSGVESESHSGRGERRFLARRNWSSSSPSTLGLGRFLEIISGTMWTSGGPAWGPAILRTEE
jgi:hypothetical protein